MADAIEKILIVLVLSVLLLAFILFSLGYAPENLYSKNSASYQDGAQYIPEPASEVSFGSPARVKVPFLGIDAPVQHVGQTEEGSMAIPSNHTDVGWYKFGPRPGELGSAVLAGHLDSRWFSAGVFRNLDSLPIGEKIIVVDELGKELVFEVKEKSIYPEGSAPLEYVFGRADKPRLNLITCDGTWDQSTRRYDQRLVVFAELI